MTVIADSGDWTVDWPYPQMFFLNEYVLGVAKGDGVVVAATTLSLYEMFLDYGEWNAVRVGDLGTVSEIDHVDVADFGPYYVVSVFGYDSESLGTGETFERDTTVDAQDGAITSTTSTVISSCNFNGQFFAGGFLESFSYDDAPSGEPWTDLGVGHIAWGGIGNLTFKPTEDRTAGFTVLPWTREGQGKVLKVAAIGKGVMAFGDYGHGLYVPYAQDNAVGFGLAGAEGSGINYNNHVAGDQNVLIFIDKENELWLMDKGNKLEKLGYKEFLEDLTNADIRVSYVPQKKIFYISDGTTGYGLTEYGLYSMNQLVISAGMAEGTLYGFWDDDADYELRLETDTLDFGQRGMKSLMSVEVGASHVKTSSLLEIASRYKYSNLSATYTSSPWKRTDFEGVARPIVTSSDHRIRVRASDYRSSTTEISYVKMRLKMSDKRSMRGEMELSNRSPGMVRGTNAR